MRGISLDEIATATKISARNLRALEDEKFKQLPGGIFNKGFVRAYAKFLGIDEDQMVAEYVTASQDTETARDQKLHNDLSRIDFKRNDEDQREISLEPKSQWGTIAVIVLVAAAVFGGYQVYQKRKADRLQRTQTPAPVVAAPTPQAIANGNSDVITPSHPVSSQANTSAPVDKVKPPDASKPDAKNSPTATPATDSKPKDVKTKPAATPETGSTASTPIDVVIHADQKCWVSIIADGKTIMEGDLDASAEKAVRARDKVVLVLGNAAGVEVSYNGKPLENLGTGQKVKKITFTPGGYE